MNCITIEQVNGVEIITFKPTPKMRLFAFARSLPEFSKLSDEKLASHFGLGTKFVERCRKAYDPHFTEWLPEAMATYSPSTRRHAIEMVGLEKALEGKDFNFWKAFALKEKVIDPDTTNLNLIPASLGEYANLSESEIIANRNSIMAQLRGISDPGTIDVSPGTPQGEHQSDPSGTPPMQEEPLAFLEDLDSNGERTR